MKTGCGMRRPDPETPPAAPMALRGLLSGVLSELGLTEKLRECRALLAWEKAAGTVVAARARPLRIRRGRLELAVPSAVWRAQLSFARDDLVRRVNELAGETVIREIAILNQPLEEGMSLGSRDPAAP